MKKTSGNSAFWALEAKKRIGADFELAGSLFMVQRAVVSEGVRKRLNLSKTQLEKTVQQQDAWIRTKLTRLSVLEVVLERRRLLGKLVWWLYDRMMARMKKPPKKPLTMRPNPAAVPADQRDPTKGAQNGVAREVAAETVPSA
jgi:predicted metal-dependent hydrolase